MPGPKKWHLNIDLSEREADILLLALDAFGGAGYSRTEVVELKALVERTRAIDPEWDARMRERIKTIFDPENVMGRR